ncbi:MAG: homoaconitate hydratase [Gracilibacter sp. BRH_c7a]|nr:MAG: homoaconitate hydratase [Gracilibacter sp. BRH_c7a]
MTKLKENGLIIVDTTLRDGEQTAGVVFSNQEKIRIARMLDEVGVQQIEAGIPVMGGDELEAIKTICKLGLKASIMGWNRPVIKDIEASVACGCDSVAISISTSDIHIKHKLNTTRGAVLDMMVKATEYAKENFDYISVNAEDASRADMNYLVEFATEARKAGASRVRYCDTIGILEPFTTYERVKTLIERAEVEVEMHTHNDFGMATANALAGVRAGARFVGVTVNGLGERAGNAAMEEVVMALKHIENNDLDFDTKRFVELSEYVSRASGRLLPPWKAIVGSNMFAHESGIHADATLKNPNTYEVFRPEEVGLERQIVIGKHSGTASIKSKFREYGREITDEQAKEILKHVRALAIDTKRSLFDKEIIYIYADLYETDS